MSCMIAGGNLVFVDSNVLLYDVDFANTTKQLTARRWLEALWIEGTARISWQVLNEFYAHATGKMRVPATNIRRLIDTYVQWKPGDFSFQLLERAWHWIDHAGVPYWDALILAAAERAGCRWLLSEDFSHGRKYGPVEIVNPFLSDPNGFPGT
jgi:predicted nucleic acid-binding protein